MQGHPRSCFVSCSAFTAGVVVASLLSNFVREGKVGVRVKVRGEARPREGKLDPGPDHVSYDTGAWEDLPEWRYKSAVFFDPKRYGVSVLQIGDPPRRILPSFPNGFNPTLGRIPAGMLSRLNFSRATTNARPEFLSLSRCKTSQCQNLIVTSSKHFKCDSSVRAALVDRNLELVEKLNHSNLAWKGMRMGDVSIMVRNDKMYIHYSQEDRYRRWCFCEIKLESGPNGITAVTGPPKCVDGRQHRNYVPIWDGNSSFIQLIRWLTEPYQITAPLHYPEGAQKGKENMDRNMWVNLPLPALQQVHGLRGQGLHANSNALLLDAHTMLVVGHIHMNEKNVPFRFGNTYFHYFLLVEPKPPFRLIQQSPPFCLPALANRTLCEVIQFVSGLVRWDETTVLISYGINDCGGATTRIKIKHLLRFAFSEGSRAGPTNQAIAAQFNVTSGVDADGRDPSSNAEEDAQIAVDAVANCTQSSPLVDRVTRKRLLPKASINLDSSIGRTGAGSEFGAELWQCRCAENYVCEGPGCSGSGDGNGDGNRGMHDANGVTRSPWFSATCSDQCQCKDARR